MSRVGLVDRSSADDPVPDLKQASQPEQESFDNLDTHPHCHRQHQNVRLIREGGLEMRLLCGCLI